MTLGDTSEVYVKANGRRHIGKVYLDSRRESKLSRQGQDFTQSDEDLPMASRR